MRKLLVLGLGVAAIGCSSDESTGNGARSDAGPDTGVQSGAGGAPSGSGGRSSGGVSETGGRSTSSGGQSGVAGRDGTGGGGTGGASSGGAAATGGVSSGGAAAGGASGTNGTGGARIEAGTGTGGTRIEAGTGTGGTRVEAGAGTGGLPVEAGNGDSSIGGSGGAGGAEAGVLPDGAEPNGGWACSMFSGDCFCFPTVPGEPVSDTCTLPKPPCCFTTTAIAVSCTCTPDVGTACTDVMNTLSGTPVNTCPTPGPPPVAPDAGGGPACRPADTRCEDAFDSCCSDSLCVYDDSSLTTATCSAYCQINSDCVSNCCAVLTDGVTFVCSDPIYCP